MRVYYRVLGGHVHCRVFTSGSKCGDLVFTLGEWVVGGLFPPGAILIDESDAGQPATDLPKRPAPWINTATGRRFNFFDVSPADIDIVDIAVALSHQARYAGHTRQHWSVAWHSILVAAAVENCGGSLDERRWGLLHDAAEAYVTDIPWPHKAAGLVDGLAAVEKHIMLAVVERFVLSPTEPARVKEIDLEMLDLEAGALLERHPDWPAGTPRPARPETVAAFGSRRIWTTDPDQGKRSFMGAAMLLGLATPADAERLELLIERGDAGRAAPTLDTVDGAAARMLLGYWEQEAGDHEHADIKSREPSTGEQQWWWDEGYRCGILSAVADLAEHTPRLVIEGQDDSDDGAGEAIDPDEDGTAEPKQQAATTTCPACQGGCGHGVTGLGWFDCERCGGAGRIAFPAEGGA
jgi:hypothetical protein